MKPGEYHNEMILLELSNDFILLHLLCARSQRVTIVRNKKKKKEKQGYLNK